MILILDANDRFAGDPLADIINRAFAFYDNDIEFRGERRLGVQGWKSDKKR